jgi:hypothetical protein
MVNPFALNLTDIVKGVAGILTKEGIVKNIST